MISYVHFVQCDCVYRLYVTRLIPVKFNKRSSRWSKSPHCKHITELWYTSGSNVGSIDELYVSETLAADRPLSESDLSEDMVEPWLSFLILSEPLCSCSSRTRSSLCCQRRRPLSCWASSSCSCSFCNAGGTPPRAQTPGPWSGGGGGVTEGRPLYLYVELGPPEQVERGVPHGVRRQGNLLLQLLQALPQLGSPTGDGRQQRSSSAQAPVPQPFQINAERSINNPPPPCRRHC